MLIVPWYELNRRANQNPQRADDLGMGHDGQHLLERGGAPSRALKIAHRMAV